MTFNKRDSGYTTAYHPFILFPFVPPLNSRQYIDCTTHKSAKRTPNSTEILSLGISTHSLLFYFHRPRLPSHSSLPLAIFISTIRLQTHLSAPFLVIAPVRTIPRTRVALPRASALVRQCPSSVPHVPLFVSINLNQAPNPAYGRRGTCSTSRPRVGVLLMVVVNSIHTTLQVRRLRGENARIPASESSPFSGRSRVVFVASKVHWRGSGKWERQRTRIVGRRRRNGLLGASTVGRQ